VTLAGAAGGGLALMEKKRSPTAVQLDVRDLRERGLTMIGPGAASFEVLLDAARVNMPGAPLEAVRPYSVFIKNTGRRAVVAFMLRWELTRPDGVVVTENNQYVTKYSLTGDGVSDSDGHTIRSNAALLAFPGFAMAQDTAGLNNGDPKFAAYLERVGSNSAQYVSVTVSLDGVVFEDGGFVGPDATGFYGKVKALIDADRDLRREIETKVKSGKSADDIFTHVTEEAGKPKVRIRPNSTAEDHYNYFKRAAAEELLSMREVSGNDKTLKHALRPSKKPWPQLRKE
jgi:hypothetical protein